MIHGLLHIHTLAILKHLKSAHFSTKNGYFSVFCGSISHAFSCKHETHDLLTLVSSFYAGRAFCMQAIADPPPEQLLSVAAIQNCSIFFTELSKFF